MNIKSVSGAMFAGMITQLVSAPALSAVVYPSKIQACIASAVCNDPTLVQQESTFSAYSYLDGGAAKYLFEYNLSPSSNESTNFSSTQLSGAAWLSANAVYDLSADLHNFTLYLDGVTPSPTDLTVGDSNG